MSKQRTTKSEESGDEMFQDITGDSAPISVAIEASALTAGIECPFTDGCRGKVHVYNRGKTVRQDANGKDVEVRFQQLKCNKCNVVADGVKIDGRDTAGKSRLFNRLTGQGE